MVNDGVKVKSAYESVYEFVARTGGSNIDGRISRSFFPFARAETKHVTPAAAGPSAWGAAKANSTAVFFEPMGAHAFAVDTTKAGESRHANFEFRLERIPEDASFVEMSFKVTIAAVTRTWPKLVALVKLASPGEETRTDKETITTTRTLEETSEHRVCFQIEPSEESGVAMLHVLKDSGVRFEFEAVRVAYLDQDGDVLACPDEEGADDADTLPIRDHMLPGTADLTPIRGQKIDMIAGCETSYVSAYMKQLGFKIFHSFEHYRAMDPYTELMSRQSPYMTSNADIILLSQVQVLRPLITRIERAGDTIERQGMQSWVDATIDALRWSIEELRSGRRVLGSAQQRRLGVKFA